MTTLETRYPCPVCLGVKMEKVTVPASRGVATARDVANPPDLVLDHCARCGGVWFEAGEVQQLRRANAAALWKQVVQRDEVHAMQCHECRSHVPRTDPKCAACGWKAVLDCPECDRPMRVARQSGMRIDYCTHCKGAWFDHDELTGIWKMEVDALVKRRGTRALDAAGDVVLLDVLLYDPFIAWYGIHAAGHVIGGIGHALGSAGSLDAVGGAASGAAGAIGDAAGAASDVAAGLFETIAEIIGGIFG